MKNTFQNILAIRRNLEQEYCGTRLFSNQFNARLIAEQERECMDLPFDPLL